MNLGTLPPLIFDVPWLLLAAVVGSTTLAVNSDHHQAVELTGAGLQVVARSDVLGHRQAPAAQSSRLTTLQ